MRRRSYLLAFAVTAAVVAVVVAVLYDREPLVFAEHVDAFDRLAELRIEAGGYSLWLRGSSLAPEEAKDLIARLRLSAVGVHPAGPEPMTWWICAVEGGGYGSRRSFLLNTDTTQFDSAEAISPSRLGGWWYEVDCAP